MADAKRIRGSLVVDDTISLGGDFNLGKSTTAGASRNFQAVGSASNISIVVTPKGTGTFKVPVGYESNIASDQDIVNRAYVNGKIAGKNVSATLTGAGAGQDGYSIVWDNGSNNFTLAPGGSALTFTDGLTNSSGTVRLGGNIDEATTNVTQTAAGIIRIRAQFGSNEAGLQVTAVGSNNNTVALYATGGTLSLTATEAIMTAPGTGALKYAADYSASFVTRTLPDVGWVNTHLAGKAVNSNMTGAGGPEDTYVVEWHNAGSDFRLAPRTTFALTNGSGTTAAGTAVNLGGTLTGNVNIITAANTFEIKTSSGYGIRLGTITYTIAGDSQTPRWGAFDLNHAGTVTPSNFNWSFGEQDGGHNSMTRFYATAKEIELRIDKYTVDSVGRGLVLVSDATDSGANDEWFRFDPIQGVMNFTLYPVDGHNSTIQTTYLQYSDDYYPYFGVNARWIPDMGAVTQYIIDNGYSNSIFSGATSIDDGFEGLVPAPLAGEEDYFLKGDGTWAPISGGGASYTFSNGITNSSGTVRWGGSLTQDVAIDGNFQVRMGSTTPISSFYVIATGTSGVVNIVGDTLVTIGFHDGSNDIEFSGVQTILTTTGFILTGSSTVASFTDSRATKAGLQYAADYSGSYTSRSLVDQGYVLGTKTFTGKQTFTPGATVAGLNVGATTANPSTPVNGDLYYNSTANELRARINGAWVALGASSTGLTDGDKTDITVASSGTVWTIDNDVVTYAKMQNVSATSRFIGRITSGAGDPEELTGTQATTLLDAFTSSLKGLAPASGGGTANFLRADATWAVPQAYDRIQEDGTNLTQRRTLNFVGTAITASDDGSSKTNVTVNTTLQALADFNSNGLMVQTAGSTFTSRQIQGASGHITVTNGDGVSGDPVIDVGANVPLITQANGYTAGMKQTVTHNATNAGFNIGEFAGAPSSFVNGDMWHDSTALDIYARIDSRSISLTRTPMGTDVTATTYTFSENDRNKVIRFTNASGCTATVPTGLSLYWSCIAYRASGAGTLTFASSGTLESAGTTLDVQKTSAVIYHRGSNIHVVWGAVGGGAVSGSGTAGYVAYWGGSTSLTGEAAFAYNESTNILTVSYLASSGFEGSFGYGHQGSGSGNETYNLSYLGATSGSVGLTIAPKGRNSSAFVEFAGPSWTSTLKIYQTSSPDGRINFFHDTTVETLSTAEFRIVGGGGNSSVNTGFGLKLEGGTAYATSGNGAGGDVTLISGARRSAGSGLDGNIVLDALTGWTQIKSSTMKVGDTDLSSFLIIGLDGNSSVNDGMDIAINAGYAYTTSGNGNGGDVTINSGQRRTSGSGVDGNITFNALGGTVSVTHSTSESFKINGLIDSILLSGTSLTLSATHRGKIIYCTSGSAVTITVPSGLVLGFNCTIQQDGAGTVTLSASGTTLHGKVATTAQYDGISVVYYKTSETYWCI